MDNKLSELSKPAAYKFDHGVMGPGDFKYGTPQMHSAAKDENASPLYSQEYVSALLAERDSWKRLAELRGEKDIRDLPSARQRIAELEQKERHSERQSVIDGLARAGETWDDIEEYMVKWDEEHRKAIGEKPVRYQCREIGEGGWVDCDKARYDYCQRRPEMDTRIVTSPLAELEASSLQCRGIEQERELFRLERTAHQLHAQALEQRIAELEEQKAMWVSVAKELGSKCDALEAKLATPVQLPELCGDGENDNEYTEGLNDGINQSAKAIRAAGFTVEGDE